MLRLALEGLAGADGGLPAVAQFDLKPLRSRPWEWDQVVKASHITNCWYNQACNFNLYVKDGIVLREEQAANYPERNDPDCPDYNPKGCQKGVCYAHRIYDPTRTRYPLKRLGARGEGKWKRVSWDQALEEIGEALVDVLVTDGPDAIVQCGGTRVQNMGSDGIGVTAFFDALGSPLPNVTADNGDDHQGSAVALGKVIVGDSADNWFYADVILVWGGNPAYTHIVHHHFIPEARYNGTRVIAITPDYNPSARHCDAWIPVNPGTDSALAMSMAQVIIKENLYREGFVREQTDLPLLVREDTGRFLREKDLKRGGRDDVFYLYDLAQQRVVEAPRKSLALNGVTPALRGAYEVDVLDGKVRVTTVMERLSQLLDREYTPERASLICGVSPRVITDLAREVANARGVVNVSTANWGKFYHGDLIERAIILVFALCGHMGRKGATYSAFPMLGLDTAIGGLERRGDQIILTAAGADPRFAAWREEGYTDEMILYEYVRQAFAQGAITPTSLFYYLHAGVLELGEAHPEWDPHLRRPLGEYVKEALDKGWQNLSPAPGKTPRVMFAQGGNFLRRARATNQLIETLLPKLRLLVTIDWRMSSTALYSDYVLPVSSWYERTSTFVMGMPCVPFVHVNNKASEPLYESRSEWDLFTGLARKMAENAKKRGISAYQDRAGKERRLDRLEEKVAFGGLYTEGDEEALARDAFLNAHNVEPMAWEEFKEKGIAHYTGVGRVMRSIGNACDIEAGEPVVPLTWHTERKEPYPTLTRRIQSYIDHDWYLELGETFPIHKDHPKAGGDYPLQITGGHARWSIHSDWIDNPLMLQLQRGEPLMFMNPGDAARRGLQDGQRVNVFNDVASFEIIAAVSPGVRPGQLVIYHAWENSQFRGWHHFKSVMASPMNPIELVGDYFHIRPITMSCYPGFSDRGTRVEVAKVG